MQSEYTKWVACWGNATSIIDQKECTYSKDITLRYPIFMCFSGSALRLHFSNISGTEAVRISSVNIALSNGNSTIQKETLTEVLFNHNNSVSIQPGEEIVSDEVSFMVEAGQTISVSIYLASYTQMNSGVLVTGPLSKGYYSYGDYSHSEELPVKLTRNTNWFYFLNTIDIYTEEKNHAFICYGDSITAQSWPDYLSKKAFDSGIRDVAFIRRAICGTRILREYDCITYAAYGRKGEARFAREMNVAGADSVLIQHGINDIIHPVGVETNVFRPWEDMPSLDDLINGMTEIYFNEAKSRGYKIYVGTLLPIFGWRTYADFRNELRNQFNQWILSLDPVNSSQDEVESSIVTKVVDFDKAVCDTKKPEAFAPGFDSGDHLHPSELAYEKMADEVLKVIFI